jgi:cytochrome c5
MNRLTSAALAVVLVVASGAFAFAADAPASAPANAPSGTSAVAAHPNAAAQAAARRDKATPVEARMTHALNLLEANGYGDFSDFRQDGKNFDATVTRSGRQFTVVVDPDADQVSQQG